jgi:chemotaxis protein CheC
MWVLKKEPPTYRMSLMIDIRKLGLFNKMAKEGGNTVADHLSQMTGMETEMEITKINFIDVSDIKTHVGHQEQIGISIEMVEPPHGHILFLFEAQSGTELAHGMIGDMGETDPTTDGFTDMERSAIQEIGNIMTSGFIDGWANVLNTTIDIGTPSFIFGPGSGMVDDLVGGRDTDMALMFDSRVQAPNSDVDVKVYTFPELDELVGLMQEIEI